MTYPANLRFTKDHEWILAEGDTATVGITDFAQSELGDIVYVELPEQGKTVRAGETLGTIESVKAVSEIYAPVSGTVIAINSALVDTPEKVNKDPHGDGWLCKIKLSEVAEVATLMDVAAYEKMIGA